MLIGANTIQATDSSLRSMETQDFKLRWEGFVYMQGVAAGAPSIQRLAEEMAINLPMAASQLKGVYFLLVHEKQSGNRYAFVDSSGLFHAFYSDRFVSTSFLDLAATEGLAAGDLDPDALVEFFHFGHIAFGKTFFSPIRKIGPAQIVSFSVGGKLQLIPKPVSGIEAPPEHCLQEFLAMLAGSIAHERISVDITGGIDSRLLAVVLSYFGLPFEVASSGIHGNTDLAIAERVAVVLNRELHITYHSIVNMETSLPEIFRLADGLFDIVRYHRAFQLQRDRLNRGISLVLSGTGGELFKDFWWLQDFPFYSRKRPDLQRLYSFRIAPVELKHTYLADQYRGLSEDYRQRLLQKLSAFAVTGNTQTYDQIYYNFKMREYAGRFMTNTAHLVQCYAPYLEREAVACGYHLPRSRRFFNIFHRHTMTRLCPEAAEITTTEGGVSASSHMGKVAADLSKYAANKLYRVTRKVGQRLLGRSYFDDESPDHPELNSHVRHILATRRSLERLKEHGIMNDRTEIKEIEDRYLGNILSLDMLLETLTGC
jgi:hypothetical protein